MACSSRITKSEVISLLLSAVITLGLGVLYFLSGGSAAQRNPTFLTVISLVLAFLVLSAIIYEITKKITGRA